MIKGQSIFIVDDDEDDRMLIREGFENVIGDIDIDEAIDGTDLLEQLGMRNEVRQVSLILMDMNMPRMSGLEALAVIKSDVHYRHIPVIMISTASNPELVERAYVEGISAYMTKPLRIDEYTQMARAINVCYLNNHASSMALGMVKSTRAKNILVIEDNSDHAKIMQMALRRSLPQVNVIGLDNQNSALEFLVTQWHTLAATPQIILLDLYLPTRQAGLSLLEGIKAFLLSRKLASVPVIILSHSDHPDDVGDCYRLMANAYMVKSSDLNNWFIYFSYLCHFWLDMTKEPKKRL